MKTSTVFGGRLHRVNAAGQVRIYIINNLISIRGLMQSAGEVGTLWIKNLPGAFSRNNAAG